MVSLDTLPVIIVEHIPDKVRDVQDPKKVPHIGEVSLNELDERTYYDVVLLEQNNSRSSRFIDGTTPSSLRKLLDTTYAHLERINLYAVPIYKGVVA